MIEMTPSNLSRMFEFSLKREQNFLLESASPSWLGHTKVLPSGRIWYRIEGGDLQLLVQHLEDKLRNPGLDLISREKLPSFIAYLCDVAAPGSVDEEASEEALTEPPEFDEHEYLRKRDAVFRDIFGIPTRPCSQEREDTNPHYNTSHETFALVEKELVHSLESKVKIVEPFYNQLEVGNSHLKNEAVKDLPESSRSKTRTCLGPQIFSVE
jgi:hypothetical protein